jgi:hypothetical protein
MTIGVLSVLVYTRRHVVGGRDGLRADDHSGAGLLVIRPFAADMAGGAAR